MCLAIKTTTKQPKGFRRAVSAREKVLGNEHPNTESTVNSLANMLENEGKYEEAEKLHRQVLSNCEKVLGNEHRDTLASVSSLANVFYR